MQTDPANSADPTASADSVSHEHDPLSFAETAGAPRVRDLDLNLLKAFHAVYIEKNVGRAALDRKSVV